MKFFPTVTKSAVIKQVAGVIVGVVTLSAGWGGAAFAESGQDAMARFTELSQQAERLAETMNSAQQDLDRKMQLLSEAEQRQVDDLARLDAARAQLAGYQGNADRIAAAAYMGGRADEVNAILTAASPQTLIDNLAIQRTMASHMSEQMRVFRRLDSEARAMAAHGVAFGEPVIDLDGLRAWKEKVVGKLTNGLATMAKTRKVRLMRGVGAFLDDHHMEVELTEGTGQARTGGKSVVR